MAATAWTLWNKAKKNIGAGNIALSNSMTTLRMHLYTSAATGFTTTATISTRASATGEVTQGNGYLSAGYNLATVTWTAGASAGQYALKAGNPVWTGTGGTIPNIKYAMIRHSSGKLLCWSKLTTSQFTLAQNNTLTIQFSASGIFTLA